MRPSCGARTAAVPAASAASRCSAHDLAIILLVAVLVSFLIKTFLVRSFYILPRRWSRRCTSTTGSSSNQLVPELVPIDYGDVVVLPTPGVARPPRRATSARSRQPRSGCCRSPHLAAPDSNDHRSRVIGMPGDVVACCTPTGQLTVNGLPLDEPYITIPSGQVNATRSEFEVTVPEGSLWVMGDNRYNSADSAFHYASGNPASGFVPIDDVVGKAVVISWPLERWAVLDRYEATFSGVEQARQP